MPRVFEHVDPEALGPPKGWTNGMVAPADGRVLFVAGQDAADPDGRVTADGFVEQFDRALGKVLTVVEAAGGGPESVGRMTIYVTELDTYRKSRPALGGVYRARMGKHFPAMSLVEVSRLVEPGAKVEIEATAVLPGTPTP